MSKNQTTKSNRTERITVRLSSENKTYLENLKTQFDYDTFEDLIMSIVNEQLDTIEKNKVYIDKNGDCIKAINHLNKYATNLNQLAKIANKNGSLTNEQLQEFQNYQTQLIRAKNHISKNVKILKGRL